jgi:K+-transporting ATPase ATPase C chain
MKTFLPAARMFIALTVLTGAIYPAIITGLAKTFFKSQAEGSLISVNGKIVGSELLAQRFGNDNYFWPRPSRWRRRHELRHRRIQREQSRPN